MKIFPTVITNLPGRAEAWDESDVRETKKGGEGVAAAFVFLGTEKSRPDQSEAEGAVNLGKKNKWNVMREQRNRLVRNTVRKMQSGKNETVMEEKDEKIWA